MSNRQMLMHYAERVDRPFIRRTLCGRDAPARGRIRATDRWKLVTCTKCLMRKPPLGVLKKGIRIKPL